MSMKTAFWWLTIPTLALSTAVAWSQHDHGSHHPAPSPASAPAGKPVLQPPPAMREEHATLHQRLAAALHAGGKTASAAQQVQSVLHPHFLEEEAYAMPPLSILEAVAARRATSEQMQVAIEMADKLESQYARMLHEHEQIAAALKQLEAAATAEAKPEHAQFARDLTHHAQHEQEVLYPSVIVLGRYLKLQQHAAHQEPQTKH